MIKETGVSNRLDTLSQLKGEVVKGVFAESREGGRVIHILFESGYALTWHNSTGSHRIASRDDVRRALNKVKADAKTAYGDLTNLLELAGEKP